MYLNRTRYNPKSTHLLLLCVWQLMGTLSTSRPKVELINRVTSGGLSVSYTFTRTISVLSSRSVSVELSITNFSDQPVNNLHISNKVGCFQQLQSLL